MNIEINTISSMFCLFNIGKCGDEFYEVLIFFIFFRFQTEIDAEKKTTADEKAKSTGVLVA